jgi:uncharacterized protein
MPGLPPGSPAGGSTSGRTQASRGQLRRQLHRTKRPPWTRPTPRVRGLHRTLSQGRMPCPRRGQHRLPEERRPREQHRLREQQRPGGLLQQSEPLQRRGQQPERNGWPDRKPVRGGEPVRERTPRQAPLRQRPCKLDSARAAPVRTCIGCGARAAKHDLVRLVAAGDQIVPDITARQPGRGAYLHPSLACLERAQRRKAFSRALRLPAPLPASKVTDYLSGE